MYLILIVLAAFFYACHERLQNNFAASVFSGLNPKFWDGAQSDKTAKKLFGSYPLDGKHLAMALMFVSLLAAVPLGMHPFWAWAIQGLKWYYQVAISGAAFTLSFDFFYNRLLKRAPKVTAPAPVINMPGL